jgi:outer membrane receptor for ferrienterochelin and colicins
MKFRITNAECRIILSLILFLIVSNLSFAFEIPRFYGEEIVVTAARIPQLKSKIPWSVSLITKEDLKLSGAKYLSDALSKTVGTDITSNGYLGAVSSVRLRGSSSQQVLVLVDGKRANSPLYGGVDLSNYPVDEIERIEVVRTPLSAVYGADAVGGVVNVVTQKPSKGAKGLSVALGSFNEQKVRLSYGYTDESWQAHFNAGQDKTDGFRPNSQFTETDYDIKIGKPLAGTSKVEVEYSNLSADKRVPGSATYPSPNASQKDRNNIISVSFTAEPGAQRSYSAKVYQRGDSFHYLDPDLLTDSAYQSTIAALELQQQADNMTFGFEARQDAAEGSVISGYKAATNLAFYTQGTWGILDVGLRGDKHSTFGSILTPRAGIKKQVHQDISLSLACSGAFRAPVLNELYGNYPAYYVGSLPYLGNPNLRSERGYLAEIALEYEKQARLTVFAGKTTDLITGSWPVNSAGTAYSPENLDSVTRQGVEMEYNKPIAQRLRSVFSYTYQKCTDDRSGDKLVYLPENKANLSLLAGDNLGGGSLVARYVGERPYIDYPLPFFTPTRATLPDFLVIDLHVFRKIWGMEISLGADNLFDRSYQLIADYPQPGRRFLVGVKWEG